MAPPPSQSSGRFQGIELTSLSCFVVAHPLKNTTPPTNNALRKTMRIVFTEFVSLD
jgi:hypothetical protein